MKNSMAKKSLNVSSRNFRADQRPGSTAPRSAFGGKILILGAKGSLGQQLVKVFKEGPLASSGRGNEVIAWDKEEIDITDKGLILKKVGEIKPAVIINAAAYNAVDKCESEEEFELAQKINGKAVGYLAEAAMSVGAILIHYSSDYVFEGTNKQGYKEGDEPKPPNKYGETKRLGEEEIIRRSGKGLKWYLIRTSKLFGPKGASSVSKPSFFDLMLKLGREREVLEAVNEEVSCFTYTPDLAKETKKLIDENKGYGIYHITNSGGASWYKAARELFKILGLKTKVKPIASDKFPRPAKRPKYSVLLNTKLKKLRSWQEALHEYLNNN